MDDDVSTVPRAARPEVAGHALLHVSVPSMDVSVPSLYREIFQNASQAIAIVDAQGRYIEQNALHRSLIGYSDAELRGRTPAIHLGEETFARVVRELQSTGRFLGEVLSRTRDGRRLDIELSAFAVCDAAGTPVCYVGVKRDITEQRRAERAQRESDERYRRLVDACPLGVLVVDDGRIAFLNPSGARLLGAERPAQLLGWPVEALVHPESSRAVVDALWHADVLESVPAAWRFVRLDGEIVDVELTSVAFTYEGRSAVQLVLQDITERKHAERALRFLVDASTTLADSLHAETTVEAIARLVVPRLADWCLVELLPGEAVHAQAGVAHADGAQAELARRFRRCLEDTMKATKELDASHLRRPELVTDVHDGLLQVLARSEEHLELLRLLGILSYLRTPLLARGRLLGSITLITTSSGRRYHPADLTLAEEVARRAALALDNARLYQEAREAVRVKHDFLAAMSHELRTPLNAIGGYAELLQLGVRGPVTESQREDLHRIQVNQRHLLALVNDLLNVTRLEHGQVAFELRELSVSDVLAELRPLVEPQIHAKRLVYAYRAGDPSATCRADPEKLRQVVLNLLFNAVKFTDPGGTITLDWRVRGRLVLISVRDTGCGIPADKLEAIFDPFVRVETGLTRGTDGAGLGLAISRDLARGMGGDITVVSTPGRGSAFTLTLPKGTDRRTTPRRV